MIARVWFRKGGASDGFWWEAEVGGVRWLCADVEFRIHSHTEWERDPEKPRNEQRHFIEAEATDFHWDGPRLVLT